MKKVEGVIKQESKNIAHCITKDYKNPIKIKKKYLTSALHNDTVIIKTDGIFGMVSKITKRSSDVIIGKASLKNNVLFITPISDNIFIRFFADSRIYTDIQDGDIILFTFRSWKKTEKTPVANIIKKISIFDALAMKYDISTLFTKECIQEAEDINIQDSLLTNREDLRYLNIVSYSDNNIFSSGISFEDAKEGFRVGIHVPDLSEALEGKKHILNRLKHNTYGLNDIPLLPKKILYDFSFIKGKILPCVSFMIHFDREWNNIGMSSTKSIVKIAENITADNLKDIVKEPSAPFYKELSMLTISGNMLNNKTDRYDKNWKDIAEYMIADYTLQHDIDNIIYFKEIYSYDYNGRCLFTEPLTRYADIVNQKALTSEVSQKENILHMNNMLLSFNTVKKVLERKNFIHSLSKGQEILGTVIEETDNEYTISIGYGIKSYIKKRKTLSLNKGDKNIFKVGNKCEDTLTVILQ